MPEIQWTSEAVEAKAKEMIGMWEPHCASNMETALAHHVAYLTALSCNCRRRTRSMSAQSSAPTTWHGRCGRTLKPE